jgi:hypothetical protein
MMGGVILAPPVGGASACRIDEMDSRRSVRWQR